MPRATFLRVLLLALLGTAVTASLVVHDAADADLAPNRGHDGQQFYAIARAPMHLDDAAEHLDRPRYRLQRPLFPVLAWALHPSGGGTGLVWALIAVGVAGVLLSGLGAGALSTALGGGAWPALLVPVLPGADQRIHPSRGGRVRHHRRVVAGAPGAGRWRRGSADQGVHLALWRRGPRHPLFGPLAAMTAFASVLAASVVALDFNATRTLAPLLALAILTLGTPTPASESEPAREGAPDLAIGARR